MKSNKHDIDVSSLNWEKGSGLLPAIIQDADNSRVLVLGFMNQAALIKTFETNLVTFFSRTKNRLWTKGETSGNFLNLVSVEVDCDNDTILVQVRPKGPVCHLGKATCFNDNEGNPMTFLTTLSELIKTRKQHQPKESYTAKLFQAGKSRIAQKVGEESVELLIACMRENKEEILNEAADLIFHLMVLLEDAELDLSGVSELLFRRHHGA